MLVPNTSYDQKGLLTPDIDHLDLRNAMVPFMVLSAAYDAHAGATGMI